MNVEKSSKILEKTEKSLPKHYYLDDDHFQRELDAIWFKRWLYVARSETLEKAGDYQVFEIGGQSIVITRGKGGAIHAFHNTCRHRGSILTTESKGHFTGAIACPYHNWTYSLEGELINTPQCQLDCDDFDKKDFPLYRVGVEEWEGFIFVCLNPDEAQPLLEGLEEKLFIPELNNWNLSELRSAFQSTKVINCNWKIFMENFAECFHCPGVHPEFCELVPIYGKALLGGDPEALENHKANPGNLPPSGFAPGAHSWSMDGKSSIPRFPDLTDEDVADDFNYYKLQPGFIIESLRDVVSIVRILPLGTEKTEVVSELLFHPSVIGKHDDDIKSICDFLNLVMEQDCGICEVNQKGLRSNRFEHGVLVPQEYAVHDFQQWVLGELGEL